MGESLTRAVTSFFTSGGLLPEVNNTLIVLIPKSQSPTSFSHFRPISLCNIIYKTISKLIVAKMRPLLHKLISPSQSAFIPDRWIVKNQVLVHELLHSFKKRKVKYGIMATKLDLQKVYDKVNWKFLEAVLSKFGFHKNFVTWIMVCVRTISSAILINGGVMNQFKPSRGL